ncbi:aquaporin [Candidatus Saccharibacteria bacterium]|nr:aquaporin [Candidatus Saccharibacteria bacterium]
MATKKPKSSAKSAKSKTTKPKTATKTVEEPVSEGTTINTVEATTTTTTFSAVEETTIKTTVTSSGDTGKSCLKGFFAKKYEEKESILTIFKNHKFYGALLGEVIGTLLLSLLLFSLSLMGLYSMATYSFAVVAIFVAVYAFSSACLNPIVTIGMMASRRMSVIRGVMYIIAEIIGAWLGWLIFNSFHLAGGDTAYDIPAMAEIADGQFWIVTLIELLGAIIIAFFFARALKYKRSVFTFGAIIAGGLSLAIIIGYVVSAAFLGLNNNFVFNPAAALMLQIFPTAGEGFGEIMGGVGQALTVYCLFPMIGGIIGFYLSDFTARLSGEKE